MRLRDMRAVGCCRSSKLHIFSYCTGLLQYNSGSQDIANRLGFSTFGSQDTELWSDVLIYTFCYTLWSQTTNPGGRRLRHFRHGTSTAASAVNFVRPSPVYHTEHASLFATRRPWRRASHAVIVCDSSYLLVVHKILTETNHARSVCNS